MAGQYVTIHCSHLFTPEVLYLPLQSGYGRCKRMISGDFSGALIENPMIVAVIQGMKRRIRKTGFITGKRGRPLTVNDRTFAGQCHVSRKLLHSLLMFLTSPILLSGKVITGDK